MSSIIENTYRLAWMPVTVKVALPASVQMEITTDEEGRISNVRPISEETPVFTVTIGSLSTDDGETKLLKVTHCDNLDHPDSFIVFMTRIIGVTSYVHSNNPKHPKSYQLHQTRVMMNGAFLPLKQVYSEDENDPRSYHCTYTEFNDLIVQTTYTGGTGVGKDAVIQRADIRTLSEDEILKL